MCPLQWSELLSPVFVSPCFASEKKKKTCAASWTPSVGVNTAWFIPICLFKVESVTMLRLSCTNTVYRLQPGSQAVDDINALIVTH